jgi:ABC-type phosphate transport system substrate-binding protein
MRLTSLLKTAVAIAAAAVLGHAGTTLAAPPNASLSPDTDALRTGGCTGCFITQMNAVTAQFQEITRAFRGCYAGGTIQNDGSGCADGVNGRLADFVVLQGVLKSCVDTTPADGFCDTGSLGVPNGALLGEVTYRVSGNGSGSGIACSRTSPAPIGIGFLAPEGFDGTPNTTDDAGGTGAFGVPGPGTNPNTSSMSSAPLTNCQGKTKIADFETVAGTVNTFSSATNGELCVVNYDLNSNGSISNDTAGPGVPGALTTVGSVANNESTNLRVSCDTGFADLPPGDFLPPRDGFNQQDVFGAQIFKIAASRDAHAAGNNDAKLHLNDPQVENLFGEPASNSVCRLPHVGGSSTSGSENVTACIRPAGSGSRETFRTTFMADTAGSKTQSEDGSGVQNGTTSSCLQTKEAGGTQVSTKRVKLGAGNADVINCLSTFSGSFGYVDADRFGASFYGAVIEGVDPDAAVLAAPPNSLKDLVKCGHYRFWGPLAGGVGAHNPSGSAFITAHRAALKNKNVFLNAVAYLPLGGVGFTKNATDGSYSIAFLPTTCPAAPPAALSISASPTVAP